MLDNPIYCGKLAFGRRKNEKIPGTRNEYHIVKQKEYMLSDGIHEAIISEEMWNQAHRKRQETGVLKEYGFNLNQLTGDTLERNTDGAILYQYLGKNLQRAKVAPEVKKTACAESIYTDKGQTAIKHKASRFG